MELKQKYEIPSDDDKVPHSQQSTEILGSAKKNGVNDATCTS